MTGSMFKGYIHSFQSLGTVDGPGIRFVVFMQGCPLRCGCCHNPDTWEFGKGTEYTAQQVLDRIMKYREYFGAEGGITISGGEPLMQPEFCTELFEMCHDIGINTCLDTSGCVLNDRVKTLLDASDRVLLDIKYTDDDSYKKYVGCNYSDVLTFLNYLSRHSVPTTLRQVIIPGLNDNQENIQRLNAIAKDHPCVDNIELLPFRKICKVKYDNMKLIFPFANIPEPDASKMKFLKNLLLNNI